MQLKPVRTLDVERPMASGHTFVSAASGLVMTGGHIYVAADDACEIAVFDAAGDAPGRLFPIIADELPRDAAERKKKKPDFEILVHLPESGENGALIALGSCSKKRRMRGAVIALGRNGLPGDIRLIDLAPLCELIEPMVGEINLEGALVEGDRLLLFNRGNARAPECCVIETGLGTLLDGSVTDATPIARFTLPAINGVPLTVTDACMTAGSIVLSAAAEASDDSYADGAIAGAALVRLDADFQMTGIDPIDPPQKVEGVSLGSDGALYCVTDADDPDCPAMLYRVFIA